MVEGEWEMVEGRWMEGGGWRVDGGWWWRGRGRSGEGATGERLCCVGEDVKEKVSRGSKVR